MKCQYRVALLLTTLLCVAGCHRQTEATQDAATTRDRNGSVHILWSVPQEGRSDARCWYYRNGPASTPFGESIKRSQALTPGYLDDAFVKKELEWNAAWGAWITLVSGIGAVKSCPVTLLTSFTPASVLPGILCAGSLVNGSLSAHNTVVQTKIRVTFQRQVAKTEGQQETNSGRATLLRLRDAILATTANSSDTDLCPNPLTFLSAQ